MRPRCSSFLKSSSLAYTSGTCLAHQLGQLKEAEDLVEGGDVPARRGQEIEDGERQRRHQVDREPGPQVVLHASTGAHDHFPVRGHKTRIKVDEEVDEEER